MTALTSYKLMQLRRKLLHFANELEYDENRLMDTRLYSDGDTLHEAVRLLREVGEAK